MKDAIVFWGVTVFYWSVLTCAYGMLLFGWFRPEGS